MRFHRSDFRRTYRPRRAYNGGPGNRAISYRVRRRTRPMPADQSSVRSKLQCIRVHLIADDCRHDTEAGQLLLMHSLASALLSLDDSIMPAWCMCCLPGGNLATYELRPLPGYHVAVEAGLSLVEALLAQPRIATAEPIFITLPDAPFAPS